MKSIPENTPRVLAVALVFFGALALLAWLDGVFARIGTDTVAALALFAAAYAFATYLLDPGVRAFVNARLRRGRAKSPAARRAAT